MLLITTSPITRDDARAISRWRYEPTYSIYDGNPNLVRVRPDLTGRGLGQSFVEAVVEFATQTHAPESLRLTVAAFNRRAIRVYEKCGFTVTQTFGRSADGEPEWVLMHKKRV